MVSRAWEHGAAWKRKTGFLGFPKRSSSTQKIRMQWESVNPWSKLTRNSLVILARIFQMLRFGVLKVYLFGGVQSYLQKCLVFGSLGLDLLSWYELVIFFTDWDPMVFSMVVSGSPKRW